MKILIAVDGSQISLRAVRFAIQLGRKLAKPPRLTLLGVDPPLFPGVDKKIGAVAARQYHADNHEYMLQAARRALARTRLPFDELPLIGDIAATILETARQRRVDLMVLGSHGRGAIKGILLGSVSSKVIAQTDIPVTIVR